MFDSVLLNRRTAVRGCISSSKTLTAAVIAHAWLQLFLPAKVFATAPSQRQVEKLFWAEFRTTYHKSRVDLGGEMMPKAPEFKVADDWFALGYSTDDPNKHHGFHGRNILFIIDEAQGMAEAEMEAIENVMADGEAHMLLLMNTNTRSGTGFRAFHSEKKLWNGIQIKAEDTPNYRARRIIIPGVQTYEAAQEWREKHGPKSNFALVKVDAEFPGQLSDSLVPFDWIEKALATEAAAEKWTVLGVDVARFGDDETVITAVSGRKVYPPVVILKSDTMAVTAAVVREMNRYGKGTIAFVDEIGLGAGVVDRLKELKKRCVGVNVACASDDPEKFANLRSQLWWNLREALDPLNGDKLLDLPKDDVRDSEMSSIRYKTKSSGGQIQIESKDEFKKRNGRSSDRTDALNLALHGVKYRHRFGRGLVSVVTAGDDDED